MAFHCYSGGFMCPHAVASEGKTIRKFPKLPEVTHNPNIETVNTPQLELLVHSWATLQPSHSFP